MWTFYFSWECLYYACFHFFSASSIFQDIKWVIILFPLPLESNSNFQDPNGRTSVSLSNFSPICPFFLSLQLYTVQKHPQCLNVQCFWLCCSLCLEWSPHIFCPAKLSFAFQVIVQANTLSFRKLPLTLPGRFRGSFLHIFNSCFDFPPTTHFLL